MAEKSCIGCGLKMGLDQFSRHIGMSDGHLNRCKACVCARRRVLRFKKRSLVNKYKREYSKKTYPKQGRSRNLRKKYNLSIDQYNEMATKQKWRCRICLAHVSQCATKVHPNLVVDHCHKTKKIRGLLCVRCNSGLGGFKDSPALLENAILYLNGQVY